MSNEKDRKETRYPLRSLHDFLYELDKEWDKFRTGSLIGVIVTIVLLLASVILMIGAAAQGQIGALILMTVIVAALIYTVSALLAQHRFFKKWERRIGVLLQLEEQIINEKLEKDT
jgi:uncharacterized Tic20 family protein